MHNSTDIYMILLSAYTETSELGIFESKSWSIRSDLTI